MKKIISVLLAVLMMFTSMAVIAGATSITDDIITSDDRTGVCGCPNHRDELNCACCVLCPKTDDNFRTNCTEKKYDENGNVYYSVCCSKCIGVYPCSCGCDCCNNHNENIGDKNDSTLDEYWGENEQQQFVDGFQSILKRISDFFDMVFDAIFEFLRLDEVLGRDTSAQA